MPRGSDTPDPIDVAVGRRVRSLRESRGLNQSELGRALGLTFQQVQKYESGKNRISCSKLVGISKALSVTPAYFFENIETTDARAVAAMPVLPPRLRAALERLSPAKVRILAETAEAMVAADA